MRENRRGSSVGSGSSTATSRSSPTTMRVDGIFEKTKTKKIIIIKKMIIKNKNKMEEKIWVACVFASIWIENKNEKWRRRKWETQVVWG